MARALGAGGITSTAVVAPFFSPSVSCYSPDGLDLHRPTKNVPAIFLRSEFLPRIQRPPSRVLALAPSALYHPSLSSSFCVRMPAQSVGCLRLGLSVLHGFGAAQGRLPRRYSVETPPASTRCMAVSIEKDLETWIRKTNSSGPVVVWSKTYCPYSIRVKKLFDKLGYDYQGIELDEIAQEGVQDALERVSGLSTVPNVYIGGKHIGGCDDTVALHMRGELIPLLIAAGANKK